MIELTSWYMWVFLAMLTTLSIGTLLYLLSRIFKSSELEFWSKGFVTDTISTAILVLVVVAFISLLIFSGRLLAYWNEYTSHPDKIPSALTIGGSDAPGQAYWNLINANWASPDEKAFLEKIEPHNYAVYLMRDWSGKMAGLYHRVFAVYFLISFVQHSSIVSNMASPVGWLAAGPTAAAAESMAFFLDKLDTVMFAQYMFIELIIYGEYLARFFIPAGIVLRMLPPTRGIGAIILAFGLGLGFVLPLSYIFVWTTMNSLAPDSLMMFILNHPKAQFVENQIREIMSDCDISFKDYIIALSSLRHAFDFIIVLKDYLASMLVVILYRSLIYPVVALTFLFTFIRSAGLLLGADLSEIAKGLAKIV